MSTTKKLLPVCIIVCFLLAFFAFTTSAYALDLDEIYPIRPGMDEWAELASFEEKIEACSIPADILRDMTTEDLVVAALNHPYMINMMHAYDTIELGYKQQMTFNDALRELSNRSDSAQALFDQYSNKSSVIEFAVLDYKAQALFEDNTIQVLLMQPAFSKYLTDDQLNTIKKEALSKSVNGEATVPYRALKEIEPITLLRVPATYIYTPKGTAVEVIIRGEELTTAEKNNLHAVYDALHPNAVRIGNATTNYNCHSYAWYKYSTSNTYWINKGPVSAFWTDGSWVQVTNYNTGARVVYNNDEHSAFVDGTNGTRTMVASKWGQAGLYEHEVKDCPFSSSSLRYYGLGK